MADLEIRSTADDNAGINIWTPTGVEYVQSWSVGKTGEDAIRVLKHEFVLHFQGETKFFGVLAEEDCSDAQIEDMAAGVLERTAAQILETKQIKSGLKTPEFYAKPENMAARHDLAEAFRDFKKSAAKRRASPNNRIYYQGLK